MTLLFFALLAPLLSFRWRRLAALGGGMITETFSPAPFGVTLGLFLLTAFFVERIENRLIIKEIAGWAVAALGVMGIVAFGEGVLAVMFDHVPLSLVFALFASKLIVGIILIGFFWMPVKLNVMHDKQR